MELAEILEGNIKRVPRRSGIAPFPERPRVEDFLPSSEEKARAEAGGPLLISVLHNTPRLLSLMHRGLDLETGACFELQVADVREIKALNQSRRLRVWQDPLPPPRCYLPGAEGHAGISGLERPSGEERRIQRDLCSQLVDRAQVARD